MNDWTAIFGSYINTGVYALESDADIDSIKKAAAARKFNFLHIDLKRATDKAGFLKKVAHDLDFPKYFGMNWDALSDCLTDMSWKPAAGYVLLFSNIQSFRRSAPKDMEIIREIFDSSTQYWKQKKIPFFVLVADNGKSHKTSDSIRFDPLKKKSDLTQ
jgi:RNAse (barnase) inhibitor barstar